MAFVNERIAKEDIERCLAHDRMVLKGPCVPPGGAVDPEDWTVDKEQDIYLRIHSRGREEEHGLTGWVFFWKGSLMWYTRHVKATRGERHGPQWVHFLLADFYLPKALEEQKDEILTDLRAALQAEAGGGVYSTATEYSFVMDIEFCKGSE